MRGFDRGGTKLGDPVLEPGGIQVRMADGFHRAHDGQLPGHLFTGSVQIRGSLADPRTAGRGEAGGERRQGLRAVGRQFSGHPPVVLHRFEAYLPVAAAQEEAAEGVVILRTDGIELVVVTSRAGHGQAQERLGEHVELVVQPLAFVLPDVHGRMILLAEEGPAGPQHGFVLFGSGPQPRLRKQVAGEMFLQELIVGHAGVEGADQVIAVLPGIGDREVVLVSAGFGVADEVHPVSRPPLAEVR